MVSYGASPEMMAALWLADTILLSAGGHHKVLLRSDGSAIACGRNVYNQCDIPPLNDEGIAYTQVSAGELQTALLRSDGSAVACGRNDDHGVCHGRCNMPPLDGGISYVQVAAGERCTVLLRSDGGCCCLRKEHAWAVQHSI
ncbi:unnamed protein product [Durusdinium trenchii]|uniref:Uncharacterized protein n=1 Tax=Durusdinium trenchii TaxID=1381693 RepID=A0ABP0LHH0_9DINO